MEDRNTQDITATLYLANIKTRGKNHKSLKLGIINIISILLKTSK